MRNNPIPARTTCFLALALSIVSQACLDEDPTELAGAADADPREAAFDPHEDLGESSLMMDLAREIPGFAGVFFEPGGGRLVVSVTEGGSSGFAEVEHAVLARLAADASPRPMADALPPVELVRRVVEYSFIELARHRARLRAPLFATPGVVSLSVDEEFNRIKIGLEDPSARAAVLDVAVELAVPVEMISFSEERRPKLSSRSAGKSLLPLSAPGTLQGPIADGRLRGGYAVQAEERRGQCTLGFPAILRNRSAKRVFVSSSHCSTTPFRLDARDIGQPDISNVVGYEIVDPDAHGCKSFDDCRHSDAALNRATADISLGEIGRTIERLDCRQGCSLPANIQPGLFMNFRLEGKMMG